MHISLLFYDPGAPTPTEVVAFIETNEFGTQVASAIMAVTDTCKAELSRFQALLFARLDGEIVGVIFYNLSSSAFLDPGDYIENFLFVADTLSDEHKQLVADRLRNESILDNDY